MGFRKVERKQAKLRMALTGVSNSGKTMGAMKIAKGMNGRLFFINTEKEGPDVYEDLFEDNPFDVWDVNAPYSPDKYIEAIHACEQAGADIIIIDSLSHAWSGSGGILDIQDLRTKASASKNTYATWKEVSPLHNRLIDTILQSTAHIIVTLRSKTSYEIMDINGKKTPVKIGLDPIQRPGLEYEFTLMLEIDHSSHLFTASKDRTRIFENRNEILSECHGEEVMSWLNKGVSFVDQQSHDLDLINDKFKRCCTIDDLRNMFMTVLKDNGWLKDKIIELKDKRKFEIEHNMLPEQEVA